MTFAHKDWHMDVGNSIFWNFPHVLSTILAW